MLITQEMSHDIIYNSFQDFFAANGLTLKSFRLQSNNLVYEQTYVDGVTLDEVNAFKVNPAHPMYKKFLDHLNSNYNFEQVLKKEIDDYDSFFNLENKEKDYYRESSSFIIDENSKIRKIITFEFIELTYGDDHMLLVEFEGAPMTNNYSRLFNYYTEYFVNSDIPVEIFRPLNELSADERHILRMICI